MGSSKGSAGKTQRKWAINEKLKIVTLHLETHRGEQSL